MPMTNLSQETRGYFTCFSLLGFYAVLCVVGVLTILGDPAPTLVGSLGRGPWLFSFGAAYIIVSISATYARLRKLPGYEQRMLLVLAGITFLHGLVLFLDGAYTSGIALMSHSLPLVAVAVAVSGVVFSHAQVVAVIESASE